MDFPEEYWNPLLDALPEYIILPTSESENTTLGKVIAALTLEAEERPAASDVVLNRLADVLFIEVVRKFVRQQQNSSFLAAVADSKLSRALIEFHAALGNNWTVQALADVACMSRSAFADRFQQLTGIAPMHYVTRWRMQHGYYMLTTSTQSLLNIAESCGYQSEESLGKAFRKEFGVSPKAVRRREPVNGIASMVSVSSGSMISTKILYSPLEANELRNNNAAVFIDVRDAGDYAQGHIPGAVNIPELFTTLSMTTPEGLQEMENRLTPLFRKAGVSRYKTAIIYEDNLTSRFGGSCRGYFQLTLFGHPNAGVLDGGLDQWKAGGYPLDSEPVVSTPSEFTASLQRACLATVDDIMKALDHPDIKLLDNRDKEEWLGISSSPAEYYPPDFLPRKGRIPGARWIEWHHFMECTNGVIHFKSPEKIIAICAQAGLYPNDDIIIYCFKGARAANTYIALKLAGFKHLRNYYGSWNEWSRNASLPVMSVKLMG